MNQPLAIRVQHLVKEYELGARRPRYGSLREDITEAVRRVMHGSNRQEAAPEGIRARTLRALDDVTFDVPRGSILGIIGANGAGKSTLLKILSGISLPSAGRVQLAGRVVSLLEVGTGFHPELTGAENIRLSAAILGMSHREIALKFDDIVRFAGVGELLDMMVKHYSSGQYLRLGFAVAAHLEAEILLLDEVLSVGDAQFQRKSTAKMQDIVTDGRTVIFVSHNLSAVRAVCRHAIWLSEGRIVEKGPADRVVDRYARQCASAAASVAIAEQIRRIPEDSVFSLLDVKFSQDNRDTLLFENAKPADVEIRYRIKKPVSALRICVEIRDEYEDVLVQSYHDENATVHSSFAAGDYRSCVTLPENLFAPRDYRVVVTASIHNLRYCMSPLAVPIRYQQTVAIHRGYLDNPIEGKLMPLFAWHTSREGAR